MGKWNFGRCCVLALALLDGCYLAHERTPDAGPIAPDSAPAVPCGPEDVAHANSCIVGSTSVSGARQVACLCTSAGMCSRTKIPRTGCESLRVVGDTVSFTCAMYVPSSPARGLCVRPCETDSDCPNAMVCLDVAATIGVSVDISHACFDLVSEGP
jgi:hypothetical protein